MTNVDKHCRTSTIINALTREMLGRNMQRHQEFIRLLNEIKCAVPAAKVIHLIPYNYAARRRAKARTWPERNPRRAFESVPTSMRSKASSPNSPYGD